ncbi:MAG TPA: helix-turn-helix domain-containing protein [Pyrinomonadaceae bacterium]|nr:helix-turn-helix domain-containing protein [Pyrinomonadaceae bacterium]
MMNADFVERLRSAFDNASMAEVARRLKIPHATVRNYYQGRHPAPEVLIKIANETGISLNWLLTGKGEVYAGQNPPIGLGKFLEEKIVEIVDRRLDERATRDSALTGFDVEAAVIRLDDPQQIMSEWFRHEQRDYPADYGVVFFQGWETFSRSDKVAAVRDAKRVLDRSL